MEKNTMREMGMEMIRRAYVWNILYLRTFTYAEILDGLQRTIATKVNSFGIIQFHIESKMNSTRKRYHELNWILMNLQVEERKTIRLTNKMKSNPN